MELDPDAIMAGHGHGFAPQAPSQRAEKLWQRKRRRGKERALGRRFPKYAQGGGSALPTIPEEQDENPFGDDQVKLEAPFSMFQQPEKPPSKRAWNLTLKNTPICTNAKYSGARSLPELRKRHDELQAYIEKAKKDIEARKAKDATRKEVEDNERRQAEEMRAVSRKMDRLRMADDSRAPDGTRKKRL